MKITMLGFFILFPFLSLSASYDVEAYAHQIIAEDTLFEHVKLEMFTLDFGAYGYVYKEIPDRIWLNTKTPMQDVGHVLYHELCGLFWWDVLTQRERLDWSEFYRWTPNYITPYSTTGTENYFEEWCVYTMFNEHATIDINDKLNAELTEEFIWFN